jgi:hypothetical protein
MSTAPSEALAAWKMTVTGSPVPLGVDDRPDLLPDIPGHVEQAW